MPKITRDQHCQRAINAFFRDYDFHYNLIKLNVEDKKMEEEVSKEVSEEVIKEVVQNAIKEKVNKIPAKA